MASDSSLAAAFGSLTKAVEEPTTEQGAGDTTVVVPTNDDTPVFQIETDPEKPTPEQVVTTTDPTDEPAEEDYIKGFAEKLGYTGQYEGDNFETLLAIADGVISPLKEKVDLYESNEVLKGLAAHIQAGGTPEDYFARPQETNFFQGEALAEDDTEGRERILTYFYQQKGIPDEQIETFINGIKEKGTFTAQTDAIFNQLKAEEATQNAEIRTALETERQEAIAQRQKFISEVETSFKNGLTGITVDSAIIEQAKSASLPNKQGKFGIQDIMSNLTPVQETMINTFIVALTNNKPFQFNPTKAVVSGAARPVHQVIGKTQGNGGSKTEVKSLSDLNNFFKERSRN